MCIPIEVLGVFDGVATRLTAAMHPRLYGNKRVRNTLIEAYINLLSFADCRTDLGPPCCGINSASAHGQYESPSGGGGRLHA